MSESVPTQTNTEPIWQQAVTAEGLQRLTEGNMAGHLGIAVTAVGPDSITATMPVDARTRQPMGLLHGGASVVLAETLGSLAGACCIDLERQAVVGIEINANHLRSVRSGQVTGTVRPIRVGRTVQVWETHIHDERGRLVCVSRLTCAVIDA